MNTKGEFIIQKKQNGAWVDLKAERPLENYRDSKDYAQEKGLAGEFRTIRVSGHFNGVPVTRVKLDEIREAHRQRYL